MQQAPNSTATWDSWLRRWRASEAAQPPEAVRVVGEVFEVLRDPVRRYLLMLLSNRELAEDLTQEAFFRLFQEISAGRRVDNIRPWLFRVAHNLAMDQQRSPGCAAESLSALPEPCDTGPGAAGAERRLLDAERRQRLRKALARLSPQERHCLELRAEGLRYREIAEALGVALPTVQTVLGRAIEKLKWLRD